MMSELVSGLRPLPVLHERLTSLSARGLAALGAYAAGWFLRLFESMMEPTIRQMKMAMP